MSGGFLLSLTNASTVVYYKVLFIVVVDKTRKNLAVYSLSCYVAVLMPSSCGISEVLLVA